MSDVSLAGRPGTVGLVARQARYAATDFWRARVVALLSLLVPVVWLVMIGAIAGNEVLDPTTDLRVMQFATPTALVMGVLYATLPTMAITLTNARETGVLKRLRGTPLPMSIYLSGRMLGALGFAVLAVAVALALAVVAYDVQILWRTAVASVATVLLAAVCFLSLGLGLSALCRSAVVAEGVSIGAVVVTSFISGLFTIGGALPDPVTRLAEVLPVKPLTDALQEQFSPHLAGDGWDLGVLGILLAWTAVGAAVAVWGLRTEESSRTGRHGAPVGRPASRPAGARRASAASALITHAQPRVVEVVIAQAAAALKQVWRDPGSVFFAVVLPLGLFALMATVYSDGGPVIGGVPFITHLAAGMITWGVAVTAFMNVPETVVRARDRGVLKRLRGTPLAPAQYVVGRVAGGAVLGVVVTALVLGLGVVAYGMRPSAVEVLMALGLLLLGTVTLAACGFLIAAAVGNARSFGAVSLTVLLPLSFLSDIFTIGAPEWMSTVGMVFPLKHLQNALADVLGGAASSGTWLHIAVLAAWAIVAGALALRYFRWHVTESG
ncbi:ABC transporter permease [Pseudactinotalea terrae]|uniref:ABC transporter permease n=1 Tax=Pseudactinotalea terrae TaxID=1743262 RepID=UPI0012E0E919|nr:ABC transporter permease [Pseudactinotalea terrae]